MVDDGLEYCQNAVLDVLAVEDLRHAPVPPQKCDLFLVRRTGLLKHRRLCKSMRLSVLQRTGWRTRG